MNLVGVRVTTASVGASTPWSAGGLERDHPEFIEHLKECGLDEEEIRYCCLEVLGVRDEN